MFPQQPVGAGRTNLIWKRMWPAQKARCLYQGLTIYQLDTEVDHNIEILVSLVLIIVLVAVNQPVFSAILDLPLLVCLFKRNFSRGIAQYFKRRFRQHSSTTQYFNIWGKSDYIAHKCAKTQMKFKV